VRAWVLILAVVPWLASAQSTQKALARRAEAETLVKQLLAGQNMQQALSRLRYTGEESYAAKALLDHQDSADPRRRRNVAVALGALGAPRAEPALVGFVRDPDPVVRMSAAEGLGRLRTRNVQALRPLLADANMGVRAKAAWALGQSRNAKAEKPLLLAVRAEKEPEVRAAMLLALGHVGNGRTSSALERYLKSTSESTRVAAAQALCLLGAPSGRAFARKLLSSKDRYERRQGLALFEGASAKAARPVLEPLLNDPEPALAAAAARILYQGGDPKMRDWLVLASYRAPSREKMAFEAELDLLHLTDEQRKGILKKAGLR